MPVRLQRKRTKGYRLPPNAVYVGRPSRWGNPFDFRASDHCWTALSYGEKGDAAGRRRASVKAFREWLDAPPGLVTAVYERQPKIVCSEKEIALGPGVKAGRAPTREEIRQALRGKDLACWCGLDQPCHADFLLELANAEPGHE